VSTSAGFRYTVTTSHPDAGSSAVPAGAVLAGPMTARI
jgi:hypothetical protein